MAGIFAGNATDPHTLGHKLFHKPPAIHLDHGAEFYAHALAETIEHRARDRFVFHENERIFLQIPDAQFPAFQVAEIAARDKNIIEQIDGIGQAHALFQIDGKVQKSHVAVVGFQLFHNFRRYVGNQFDFDLRIEFVVLDDFFGQNILKNRFRRADPKRTRGALRDFGELVFGVAQKLQRFGYVAENELAALRGKFHALVHAVEERRAELMLELFDRLRYGGLRNIKLFRRFGERTAPRNRVKYPVQFQIDHTFSYVSRFLIASFSDAKFFENFVYDRLARRFAAQRAERDPGAFYVLGI